MWEIIQNMATDRLWIYTGIGGACCGALFIAYMRGTRISFWVYSKWERLLDYFVNRFNLTWFQEDPEAWKKVNPKISKKIEELEKRLEWIEKVTSKSIK